MAEPHLCHADGCEARVPRSMFMCRKHWFMVPMDMRGRLLAAYQPGQERLDGTAWPSDEYIAIATRAVDAVAAKEGRNVKTRSSSTEPGATGEGS